VEKILLTLDYFYHSKWVKKYYALFIGVFASTFFIVIPFYMNRKYIFSSFVVDLLVRLVLTFSSWQSAYYVTHLEESTARFFKGAENLSISEPSFVKKIINVFLGIAGGYAAFIFYKYTLGVFAPFLEKIILIFSLLIGLLTAIPLISQYNKR